MTISVNIHEAKARFSELAALAASGETVEVCKRNIPFITFNAIPQKPKKPRQVGAYAGKFEIPDSFFEPMDEEELTLWYDAPIFPDEKPT